MHGMEADSVVVVHRRSRLLCDGGHNAMSNIGEIIKETLTNGPTVKAKKYNMSALDMLKVLGVTKRPKLIDT